MPSSTAASGKVATGGVISDFEKSIGAVDPLRVLDGSLEYRAGIENIEKELEARKKELQDLERSITKRRADFETAAAAMSESGRKQRIEEITELQLKYQSKLQTAQQYAQGAEEEVRAKILRKVQEVVAELAKELNLKLVLAGGILYAAPTIDISDKVIEHLNKKYEAEQKKIKPTMPAPVVAKS